VSVWPFANIRADEGAIIIEKNVCIMDSAFLEAPKGTVLTVNKGSIISHSAILHGCEIGKEVLVGIGAIVLDNAKVGDSSIIGAGTLIPPDTTIPKNSYVLGLPYKVIREVSEEEKRGVRDTALKIWEKARVYREFYETLAEPGVYIR
ncbi:MAG: gamma carbonic anhydrase family protein, partial [Candidatus Thermoplasmatota archaeon]